MKRILSLFSVLLSMFDAAQAQSALKKGFIVFAAHQDSLFTKAYQQKNIPAYNQLLADFLQEYRQLDSAGRKNYAGYYINAYYNLSCTYSLLNNKSMALSCLEKSIKAGYSNYAHLQEDTDLDNIRKEEKFISMTLSLRETGDYTYVLKKAKQYNTQDKRPIPSFVYQSPANPDLTALRKAFNLDSIAGEGNEVSRILNLMHWVHNLIPHDGNHENPVVKNAMNMISICKKENKTLNCRGMATVLNECYLAMGFASRFVTCLPKDSLGIDNDCHVINMVYATSLKKWLWIDPTFDAYVMNEKGELLGIAEVRERIINNEPLILNPEANWNHRVSETKEYYLYYYMAKNLYRLECPAASIYNTETRAAGKKLTYVQLLPLDYFKQSAGKTEYTEINTGTLFINYQTNNPDVFWQSPSAKN